MSNLGQNIRTARKQAGLTQREVAGAVGIDFTYLSKIETGSLEFPPSEETIRKIALVVKADADELMASSGRWVKVTAKQMAAWRTLGQAADAVLAQAIQRVQRDPEDGHWHNVPSDAINDLRSARVETERGT